MLELGQNINETLGQCWACPVFDYLFTIISKCAAMAYKNLTLIGIGIFIILLSFYIYNVVWNNIKNGGKDSTFKKTLQPVLIKSLVALTLLGFGLQLPRAISTVTLEPVATITLEFSKTILPDGGANITPYETNQNLGDNGFFTEDLRITLLTLIKATVTNFQSYVNVGLNIMNESFSLQRLVGTTITGNLVREIIIFFLGLFLTYNFGKLFIKYSFCFMDVIVAMALFAFFFPLSIVFFIFQNAADAPKWMTGFGKSLGAGQIKKLINAIVSISASILTYTIIIAIIAGFLTQQGVDIDSFSGDPNFFKTFFEIDLDKEASLEQISVIGLIVLVFIINHLSNQVGEVTKKVLSTFGITQEDSASKEMGENMWNLTNIAFNNVKNMTKTVVTSGASALKKDGDKTDSTKDNKTEKEQPKEDKK